MQNTVTTINYNFAKKIFHSLTYDNYKKIIFTNDSLPEFDKEYARALLHLRKDILGESVFEAGLASLESNCIEWLIYLGIQCCQNLVFLYLPTSVPMCG